MQTDTISMWSKISKRPRHYEPLNEAIEVDVAIVGGGITGVTAAAQLRYAGKKVAILEAHEIGGVTTGFSTGNLYIPVQPFYQHIESKFNFNVAKTVAYARQFAINYIEQTVRQRKIACHFTRRPWYIYTVHQPRASLEKEIDIFKRMEIPIEYTNSLPLEINFKKAAIIPNQARFNPMQYVISLAATLYEEGCMIYENTRVLAYEEKDRCLLKTKNGTVTAKQILLATHTPIGVNATQMFTAPYRSYVVAAHLKGMSIYPDAHLWDLDQDGPTTSTHAEKTDHPEILMVAGSHHKTGQDVPMNKHYEKIESFIRAQFPVAEIAYRWSAQHYQSADDIPYVGLANHTTKNIYLATGYFADGLVYGTLSAIIIADLILGNSNNYAETFKSKRFKPFASFNFLAKENLNVFFEYLSDLPKWTHVDFTTIEQGEGKVLEINREKCAVSRDANNQLHIVSAVCTHMKCIVQWNNGEKTWDCPCHGSRFTPQGEVIEGPAIYNLANKKNDV